MTAVRGDPRRLGTFMLAFGLIGFVLATLVAVGLLGGALAARNLDDRVQANQGALAERLDKLTGTIATLGTTTGNAGSTLSTTSGTLAHAGDLLDGVATVSDDLAGTLDVSILGRQPFAAASTKLQDLSGRIRVFEADAKALGASIATNATDMTALKAELQQIGTQVGDLANRLASFDGTGELLGLLVAGILLLALLVGWLAVLGFFCAWAGWRLRRGPEYRVPETVPVT